MIIYMTDDVHRPSNTDGTPIEQNSSQLQVIVNGYVHKWYVDCNIAYTVNSSSLGAKIQIGSYIFGKNNGSNQTLRLVAQVSASSDFSTYTEKTITMSGGRNHNNGNFYVYARKANDGLNSNTMVTHNRLNEAPGSGDFFGYYGGIVSADPFNLSITNKQIWIRIKAQVQNNGAWDNCSRGSGLSIWKVLTTYAPFYQAVTIPSHFYGNDLNTFNTSIGANFISEITDTGLKDANGTRKRTITIVRNEVAPYVTSGTATTHLYCWPYSTSSEACTTYTFTITLRIVDPSDSNVNITVAKRIVTGSVEYKATPDDISPIDGTPSWSITDPDDIYDDYGLIIKNIMSTLTRTITVRPRYGRNISVWYKNINGVSRNSGISNDVTSVTIIENVDDAQYNYCSVGISVIDSSNVVYNDITEIPVVTYYAPSIPVFSIHRCDQDGTSNDKGTYCKINWGVVVNPINNLNIKKLVIHHPQGETTYDPLDSYTQNGTLIVVANTEYSYPITLELTDAFNTITRSTKLSTATVIMDWLYNGRGVGFGKVANKENTVEIAEEWKLLAYEMWINDIDVGALLKKLFSRILTLEQFTTQSQSGNTQYVVTFYNGSEWLNSQWVQSGQDATDPRELSNEWQKIDTPTKESTDTQTYQFLGWSRNSSATQADSNALKTITANTSVYAVFSSATRMYTVNFLNGTTPLQTETDLQYHYSTNYSGSDPVGDEGYTFVGWCPSGRIIEESTDAKAIFFDNTEITDDWKTIMQSVIDGTASEKYHAGQYKVLDCGTEGQIKVRIKGFHLHKLSGTEKKARITWDAIECLSTQRRMNPAYSEGVEGTGCLGGWEKSELRAWLNGDFFNLIDPIVRSQIKNVRTTAYSCNSSGSSIINSETTDRIFIPSCEEIVGHYKYLQRNYSNVWESKGIDFRYTNSSFSLKKIQGTNTNAGYWLRTKANTSQFVYYYNLSNLLDANAELEKYIGISFCT